MGVPFTKVVDTVITFPSILGELLMTWISTLKIRPGSNVLTLWKGGHQDFNVWITPVPKEKPSCFKVFRG